MLSDFAAVSSIVLLSVAEAAAGRVSVRYGGIEERNREVKLRYRRPVRLADMHVSTVQPSILTPKSQYVQW